MPSILKRVLQAASLSAILVSAAPAAGSLTPVAGWPIPAPPGPVEVNPGQGPVVLGDFTYATRLDGHLLWRAGRTPNCGNCDPGRQSPTRQHDGSYGPIGVTGDDFWAVSPAGAIVAGCAGAAFTDGTCVQTPGLHRSHVVATRAGGAAWTSIEPNYPDVPGEDFSDNLIASADDSTAYIAFGSVASSPPVAGRAVAFVASTGAVRWRTELPVAGGAIVVAERPGGGVVVHVSPPTPQAAGTLIGFGPTGVLLWSGPTRLRGFTALTDTAHNAIYLNEQQVPPAGQRTVRAIDATTGAERWIVEGSSLSLTASGDVLVKRTVTDLEGPHYSLAAITPTGTQHWTQSTGAELVGARELADNTIAYSTEDGLLHRVRPVREPVVTKATVGLSHTSFSATCNEEGCLGDRRLGTIIRVQRAKAGRVRAELRSRAGTASKVVARTRQAWLLGAGTSQVRFLGFNSMPVPPGRYRLRVYTDKTASAPNRFDRSFPVRILKPIKTFKLG